MNEFVFVNRIEAIHYHQEHSTYGVYCKYLSLSQHHITKKIVVISCLCDFNILFIRKKGLELFLEFSCYKIWHLSFHTHISLLRERRQLTFVFFNGNCPLRVISPPPLP